MKENLFLKKDAKLILELKKNGGLSYTELADLVGTAYPYTYRRVVKYRKKRILDTIGVDGNKKKISLTDAGEELADKIQAIGDILGSEGGKIESS